MKIHSDNASEKAFSFQQSRRKLSSWPFLLTLGILVLGCAYLVHQLVHTTLPVAVNRLDPSPVDTLSPVPSPAPTSVIPTTESDASLETLYIDITGKDMAQLEAKRAEALEQWILLTNADDFVPATLQLGNESFRAQLRLKGDWADHIAHDKWSFRIELQDDRYINGMRVFSIQDPSTRVYLNEYLFLENLRYEDILGVRYSFLHVVLNGEYKGIYALEEAFDKELLEFQQRREGVIIRYSEDLLWRSWALSDDRVIPPGIRKFYIVDDFNTERINSSPHLSEQRDTAVGLLRGFMTGELAAPDVFDMERMGRYLALSDLWNAVHGLAWHNVRYYFNPVRSRLEPIAFDNDPLSSALDPEFVGLTLADFNNDPYLQAAYTQALWEISQPGYMDNMQARLGEDFERLRAELLPEFGSEMLTSPWDILRHRQDLNRQRLMPIQAMNAYRVRPEDVMVVSSFPSETLMIEVGNLMNLPVEILNIQVDNLDIPADMQWADEESLPYLVPPRSDNPQGLVLRAVATDAAAMPYVRLHVPMIVALGTNITLHTRVWGLTEVISQPVVPYYALPLSANPRPSAPSLEQALSLYPYLEMMDESGWLTIPAGTWQVSGPLVLPSGYGLQLGPGTTLQFAPDAFILANGPLHFLGSAEAPVVLEPQDGVWLGIVVFKAEAPSFWQNVIVKDTAAIARDGWIFTGGVTFDNSPVHISSSRFLGTRAEDALNVIRSAFEIMDTEFAHTFSDAFDGDFTQGSFVRCAFSNIGADGIDVSGSDVSVTDTRFYDVGDKALSVGEASRLVAEDIYVNGADIGMASKDGSYLSASQVELWHIARAALAAYIKKPAYGPSTMNIHQVNFGDTPPEKYTLVQTRSYIDLNDQRIWGVDIDVDALYE